MMGYNVGYGNFGMIAMALSWIAVTILAVWVVGKLFNRTGAAPASGSGSGQAAQAPSAIEILKQRYARNEITREQFEEMRRTIEAPAL